MNCPFSTKFRLGLAAALILLVACGDEDSITAPPIDEVAPTVTITAAPAASPADAEVTVNFTVSDAVALEQVTCRWGTPDTPADLFEASGLEFSGSCLHTYTEPGKYSITVRATDAAGNQAEREHLITIGEPLPSAPTDVEVTLVGNTVTVRWTPGANATSQEVHLEQRGSNGTGRVERFDDNVTSSATYSDLEWQTSYVVSVEATNGSGSTTSGWVNFLVAVPETFLTRFTPVAGDPSCLVVEWTTHEAAIGYDVFLIPGDPYGPLQWIYRMALPAGTSQTRFCAADSPLVDGATYHARVGASFSGWSMGILGVTPGHSIPYTVDFDPPVYSASGVWRVYELYSDQVWFTIELSDADGALTGTWTDASSSGPVFGTRVFGALDLTVDWPYSRDQLHVQFIAPDELEGVLHPGRNRWVTLRRD